MKNILGEQNGKSRHERKIELRWQEIMLVNIVMDWSQGGGTASVTNFEVCA